MLGTLVVATLVLATPVHTLAAPGLQSVNLDASLVASFNLHFAQQLSKRGFRVTTAEEVATLLGVERQKQLLGCADSGCNIEIATALGVDAIITGSVARVGSGYLVNLKVIRSSDAAPLAVFSERPKSDDAVLDFLEASAADFAAKYAPTPPGGVGLKKAAPSPPGRLGPWLVTGAAVAAVAAGAVFVGLSRMTESDLRAGRGDLLALKGTGRTQEAVGYSLLGVGAALAVTSAGLWLFGDSPSQPHAALLPLRDGALFTLGGSL